MKKIKEISVSITVFCLAAMLVGWACEEGGEWQTVDDMVSIVTVGVHDEDSSVLGVTWHQVVGVDEVWVRYTFDELEWHESLPQSGEIGAHQVVISGVPENAEITFHIVVRQGDEIQKSMAYIGTTWLLSAD